MRFFHSIKILFNHSVIIEKKKNSACNNIRNTLYKTYIFAFNRQQRPFTGVTITAEFMNDPMHRCNNITSLSLSLSLNLSVYPHRSFSQANALQ